MAHSVVFRYLSYSTTIAEHAVHRLRQCMAFDRAVKCLFSSVKWNDYWVFQHCGHLTMAHSTKSGNCFKMERYWYRLPPSLDRSTGRSVREWKKIWSGGWYSYTAAINGATPSSFYISQASSPFIIDKPFSQGQWIRLNAQSSQPICFPITLTAKKTKIQKYKKKHLSINHVTSQNCISPTIRIGRDIQCLPYDSVW